MYLVFYRIFAKASYGNVGSKLKQWVEIRGIGNLLNGYRQRRKMDVSLEGHL